MPLQRSPPRVIAVYLAISYIPPPYLRQYTGAPTRPLVAVLVRIAGYSMLVLFVAWIGVVRDVARLDDTPSAHVLLA